MQDEIKKLYYSISEVSEISGLKQYVLRYWESEFEVLSPTKNRAGNRIYTEEDIANVQLIKKLLYEDKYTIEGAKQQLLAASQGESARQELAKRIAAIRAELQKLLKALDRGSAQQE